MRTTLPLAMTLAFALASAAPIAAQTEEIPLPGPEHERLWGFLGEWTGDEVFADSSWTPGGDVGRGTYVFTRTLGGMFVELSYSSLLARGGAFEGRGFLGVHPVERRYQYWWFDPTGVGVVATGDWQDGALVFELKTEIDGKPYRLHVVMAPRGTDEFEFTMANAEGDGELQELLRATYRRVGAARADEESGTDSGHSECCQISERLVGIGRPRLDCCQKAAEARNSGGEPPECCRR